MHAYESKNKYVLKNMRAGSKLSSRQSEISGSSALIEYVALCEFLFLYLCAFFLTPFHETKLSVVFIMNNLSLDSLKDL